MTTDNSYTAEQFVASLGTEEAAGGLTLTGMAKPSEDSTDRLLFVVGTRCTTWTEVPVEMVERVDVLGTVACSGHDHPHVRLHLRAPQTPEAEAYASLLRTAVERDTTRRVVRKPASTFLDGACDFNEYEIDANGTVWHLVKVEQQGDACIGTYEHA